VCSSELNNTEKQWNVSILARDYNKISAIASIIILIIAIPPFVSWCYSLLRPLRAELTISADSLGVSFTNNTTASWTVPIRVVNYSPKEAHIVEWGLTLNFNGASLGISNQNCTHGNTDLSPAQQTEFVYLFDVNTSLYSGLGSGVFSISFIDDQGTLRQQFEFYTVQWIALQSSGKIVR
jgi:hypothetical protein